MENPNLNFINFENIRNSIKFESEELFTLYLKDVYEDLSERDAPKDKGIKGISKRAFTEYVKYPAFITEKLFNAIDRDSDGFLCESEFTKGFSKLFLGSFDETIQAIFIILDFDKDGKISKSDLRVLLSYLPVKNSDGLEAREQYKIQMKGLEELDAILNATFKSAKIDNVLSFDEYLNVITNEISDTYLHFLCFLYLNKPFEVEKVDSYKNHKKKSGLSKRSSLSIVTKLGNKENSSSKNSSNQGSAKGYLPSPKKNSNFVSTQNLLDQVTAPRRRHSSNEASANSSKNNSPGKSPKSKPSAGTSGLSNFSKKSSLVTSKEPSKMSNSKNESPKKSEAEVKHESDFYNSPSRYFKNDLNQASEFSLEDNLKEFDNTPELIIYEDNLFRLNDGKTLTSYYSVLIGKEIIMYTNQKKDDKVYFHNLSGCFIKEASEPVIKDKVKYFSFSIIFSKNVTRQYLCNTQEGAKNWVTQIKKAIGYSNFQDYYEMLEDIDEGRFGKVNLGINKSTGQKVAIKVIKKEKLLEWELELQKNELDLLKIFKHPNIVRLLDHYENDSQIIIVMEHLSGGNLLTYLNNLTVPLTEKQAARIIYSIAQGIKYMNSFGVIHRDIKPDNIMFTDNSENAGIKIIDFGLTKTLSPNERVNEGMGTISYVAPEVISKMPYNKEVDVWSIGILLYVMLSRKLPFDDEEKHDDEVISKKIIFTDQQYSDSDFKGRSMEVIKLIDACLQKKPEKRITIEDLLKTDWIRMNYK